MQILDDTPAVRSLGKLCEEHGYTHEWASGQKPHLTNNGKIILCKTETFVLVVVPGLSSSASSSSSSTSFPKDSSSTSPSPARLRCDDTHDQASGNRGDPLNIKNERRTIIKQRASDCEICQSGYKSSEIISKIQKCQHSQKMMKCQHLRDTDANTSQNSDSERPKKVASRKHTIKNHFSKDHNCEICKRTKMTVVPLERNLYGRLAGLSQDYSDLCMFR